MPKSSAGDDVSEIMRSGVMSDGICEQLDPSFGGGARARHK